MELGGARGAPPSWGRKGVICVHVPEGTAPEVTSLGAKPEVGLRFGIKNENVLTQEYDT